ncbi:MAG: glycosyltransferase family 2 protein [Bacteroidales bacterium]|jgi:glycosyltransferase involved in cell wall biosynthesis|nr:glycosyltransferase family 2 protein [Bacteroidales bacterium]
MKKMEVSAVLIVKNEAHHLRRILPALAWCDETVIIDDFSDDDTLSVCKDFGCRIFQHKLEGFGAQKQLGVQQATHDWILSIDADEAFSPDLIDEIRQILPATNEDTGGYAIRRKHMFMGKVFHHSMESRKFYLRLFNRQKAGFNDAKVHETVETVYKVAHLKNFFIHYSFDNIDHYLRKQNFYTSIAAEEYYQKGKQKNMLVVLLTTPFVFLQRYILHLNILEGMPGFAWALFQCWFRTVKYMKLFEKTHYKP